MTFFTVLLTDVTFWEQNIMAVNVTENDNKRGTVYGGIIPVNKQSGDFTVTKKDFQYAFG